MANTRDTILATLKTNITGTTGIATVARCVRPPDLVRDHVAAHLPAVFIIEPTEKYNYKPGRQTYTQMEVDIHVTLLDWDNETTGPSAINTVLSNVLVAIHRDITDGGVAVNTSVLDVVLIRQDFPLYVWNLRTRIEYYQSDMIR